MISSVYGTGCLQLYQVKSDLGSNQVSMGYIKCLGSYQLNVVISGVCGHIRCLWSYQVNVVISGVCGICGVNGCLGPYQELYTFISASVCDDVTVLGSSEFVMEGVEHL
ncbi:hypothetical protein DPMN_187809 [Dreissena polymorpha]|uniref:Uncharacterized protein n=1 Tax=Dreissena polymorpha TaxID=45954 RepID=A0A9D4DQ66_DREPO|nr:hypothetical protein DPMN_187809 [Dreissena polymorpha]